MSITSPSYHRMRFSQRRQPVNHSAEGNGASRWDLWLLPADRSVVKWDDKKLTKLAEKLEKVVQGAAEQSKRNIVPSANLVANKKDFVDSFAQYDKVFCRSRGSKGRWEICSCKSAEVSAGEKLLFIFGPEGNYWTRNRSVYRGWSACRAWSRIKRAETFTVCCLPELCARTQ